MTYVLMEEDDGTGEAFVMQEEAEEGDEEDAVVLYEDEGRAHVILEGE